MLESPRRLAAAVLRRAADALPGPELLPMRLTRGAWNLAANLIDPPEPYHRQERNVAKSESPTPPRPEQAATRPEPGAQPPAAARPAVPAAQAAPAAPARRVEIEPEELRTALASATPPLLLDVRNPTETARGVIPGALQIPMEQVLPRIAEIRDVNRPIVVYCAKGMRSANIATHLRDRGIDAVSLGGGIIGWSSMGGPVE